MISQQHETFGSLGNRIELPLFEVDLERPTIPRECSPGLSGGNYESCFASSIEWQT
jgi:hypothetical protein